MAAPLWLPDLFGWKPASRKSAATCTRLFGRALAPNIADVGSVPSLQLAGHVYDALGVVRETTRALEDSAEVNKASGTLLERAVEKDMAAALPALDGGRVWMVTHQGTASRYAQFEHLNALQRLFEEQPALRATLDRDYQVSTDVYVGVAHPDDAMARPFLHAAISCKWTIRSDRVQNVRHEFATLVRNRRGRLPHLVLVTAEPLPKRLISIARGTGEVDTVYHLMFDELDAAVAAMASAEQRAVWAEMVEQRRLRPYSALARDLVLS